MKCKAGKESFLARAIVSAVALLLAKPESAQAATVSVVPDADSFMRSLAPASNYGAGGALSVSGAAAVNGLGVQNGLFDTLIRFPASNIVAALDNAMGQHDWIVTGVQLVLSEMAAPDNAVFNRGIGAFEVRFQAADAWLEGTGKPNAPTSDGVTWNDLPGLVNSNRDVSLGIFTNAGVNSQSAFALALADNFITDVRQGNEVSLLLTAASPEVGFTFNSRNFGNTNAQPRLDVTALPNPRPMFDSVASMGEDIVVSFSATTNWVYQLQRADFMAATQSEAWSNVLTISPQVSPTNVVYSERLTNTRGFYRLSVSPLR